jgi:hypothetical protein
LLDLLNGTSTSAAVHAPRVTDPNNPIVYAIDLRDYAWNRPLTLGEGRDFLDAWEAIVDEVDTYGLEWNGPDADVLKRETGSRVPLLPANALIGSAATGRLYYALTGIDDAAARSARDWLGVDVEASAAAHAMHRAGVLRVPEPVRLRQLLARHL